MYSTAAEAREYTICPANGTLRNLRVKVTTAPGAGTSRTFTVRINGGTPGGGLVATISDANVSATDLVNSVAVSAGDKIDVQTDSTGATAGTNWVIIVEFDSTTSGQTAIFGGSTGAEVGTNDFVPMQLGGGSVATEVNAQMIVPCDGTISTLYAVQITACGAGGSGKSRTLTVRKNGVNTSLSCQFLETALSTNDTNPAHAIDVSAGDLISVKQALANTPAVTRGMNFGMMFVPDTAGQFILPYTPVSQSTNTGATRYANIVGATAVWSSIENVVSAPSPAITIKAMYVVLDVAPDNGAGAQSYTFTLRNAASSTAMVVAISEAGTTGSDTRDITVAVNSLLATMCAPANTPVAVKPIISYLGYIAPPQNYTCDLADGIGIADALAGVAGFRTALADGIGAAEALGGQAGYKTALADAVAIAETMAGKAGYKTGLADGIGVAEALAGVAAFKTALADALAVAESLGGTAGYKMGLADALTVAETLTSLAGFGMALADAINVAETLAGVAGFKLSLADALAVAESLDTVHTPGSSGNAYTIALADALNIAETMVMVQTARRVHRLDPSVLADRAAWADRPQTGGRTWN
jgi:hypothetical protein